MSKSNLGQFSVMEESPVSFAAVGSIIGLAFGPVGFLVGGAIGGLADVALGANSKAKARRKMKKMFFQALLKRYNTQVFISALERMGPAMLRLQALGLKPGTPQFDEALKRQLFSEIGYKGSCEIDLYGPAPTGQKRPLMATIDKDGNLKPYSKHIDKDLGKKWQEACREMYKAALQAWAEQQKEQILFERELTEEKGTANRAAVTRSLMNAGAVMLFLGYILRQKKKLGVS